MASGHSTRSKLLIAAGALVATGVAAAGALYIYRAQVVPLAGMGINYFLFQSALGDGQAIAVAVTGRIMILGMGATS